MIKYLLQNVILLLFLHYNTLRNQQLFLHSNPQENLSLSSGGRYVQRNQVPFNHLDPNLGKLQ